MITRRQFLKGLPMLGLLPLAGDNPFARKMLPVDFDIQAAINQAAANGERLVRVPPGEYNVNETIHCAPFVALDLSGVVLRLRADVDCIQAAPMAHITGGYIDCSLVNFTHSGLVFESNSFEHRFDVGFPTFVTGVQFLGPWQGERSGTAIQLRAEGEAGYVFGVTLSNIGIAYFNRGIHLSASNAPAGGWVNANQFSNVSMQCCHDFIRLDGGGGNTFANVQIQPDHTARHALYCTSQYNLLTNFFVWDWQVAQGKAIVLTDPYGYNVITTELLYQWFDSIDNRGQYNRIINPL